jgi:hypothetical protein
MLAMEFEPLFAATLLAEILFVVFGILLGLPAFKMAQRREWWVSAAAAPIVLMVATRAGGLILSAPLAVVLTLLFYALAALRPRSARWAKVLYRVLGATFFVWAGILLVTLPIRIAEEHSTRLIAMNVAGLCVSLSLISAFLESLLRAPVRTSDYRAAALSTHGIPQGKGKKKCANCGQIVNDYAVRCSQCKADFVTPQEEVFVEVRED